MLDKIVEMLGASPTQYRLLLKTEKLVEKRALEGRNDLSNMSLAVTCVFGFIISVLFTFMPFILSMDTFTFSLIGITMSMAMISLWIVPYFDILLAPINYPVIAHTPSVIKNLFPREVDTDPHLHRSVVRQFEPDAYYRRYLGS